MLNKLGTEGNFLNLIKYIFEKSTADIILKVKDRKFRNKTLPWKFYPGQ